MFELVATFVPVCVVTAYVCTVVKEERMDLVIQGTARLAGVLALGIAGFGAAVLLLSTAFSR